MRLEAALRHPSKGWGIVHHSVRESFGPLLRDALSGEPTFAALGPIYQDDPAIELLRPFMRSAMETEWEWTSEERMVPDDILERVKAVRGRAVHEACLTPEMETRVDIVGLDDWTRAGLVLEIARRRGLHVGGRGVLHVGWRMNATVTGRFGAETIHGEGWAFNPLSMGPEDRRRVRPSDHTRQVAVLDFKAMDVCSMAAIIPEFAALIDGHPDPYQKIAELTGTGLTRDRVKLGFLTWAYGGHVEPETDGMLRYHFPEVAAVAFGLPHGDFPRMVQTASAIAFRAGLSRALPLLTGDHIIPMLTVHDELVLDCSELGLCGIDGVSMALETGASERVGRPYRVGVRTGYTYSEAKGD